MILSQLLSDREISTLDEMRLNHLSYELARAIQGDDEIKKVLRDKIRTSFDSLTKTPGTTTARTTVKR